MSYFVSAYRMLGLILGLPLLLLLPRPILTDSMSGMSFLPSCSLPDPMMMTVTGRDSRVTTA